MLDSRWTRVLQFTPYVVLGLLAAFTVGSEWGTGSRLVVDLSLCGAVAIWMLVFRTLGMPWSHRPVAIAVFMSGMILLELVLVLRDGWFGFLSIATFSFAYSIVAWPWQLLAVAATAVVAGIAQSSSFPRNSVLGLAASAAVIALNVAVMCGLGWGLRTAQRQDEAAGVESERSRLAGEIHDTLAQSFAGIVTQLQAAEQADDETTRTRHTESALGLAREGLAEARRSVHALRPVDLEGAQLPEAITQVAARWSARTGIDVEVDIQAGGTGGSLPTASEVALLRTAQEALTNIERHAGARLVTLTLSRRTRVARLEVRDDGCGFDPSGVSSDGGYGGYGLLGMRRRIEALSGELVVESRPGAGTAIVAEVPA